MAYFSLAFGTTTKNRDNKIIEAFFPYPQLHPSAELINALTLFTQKLDINTSNKNGFAIEILPSACQELAEIFTLFGDKNQASFAQQAAHSQNSFILVSLEKDTAPTSISEVFLKLQLISHRLIKPNHINLEGIFSLLHNLAWTNQGPIDLPELTERQIKARLKGEILTVDCVDKFPKMVDYIVPSSVRIADTSRVRLGAHVGEGTTVMHEGFINFNAGTFGVSMVEGRISAGVMVGNGSDIGGGASIMGTLSGGGKVVVSIGENSLLGANAGLGFPLGDRCTIESGLYVTAGSKVTLLDNKRNEVETVKAKDLAGQPDLLFRRNSVTGKIECLANITAVELNNMLHQN